MDKKLSFIFCTLFSGIFSIKYIIKNFYSYYPINPMRKSSTNNFEIFIFKKFYKAKKKKKSFPYFEENLLKMYKLISFVLPIFFRFLNIFKALFALLFLTYVLII